MLFNALKSQTVLFLSLAIKPHFFVTACSCFFVWWHEMWWLPLILYWQLLQHIFFSLLYNELNGAFFIPQSLLSCQTRSKSRTSFLFLLQKTLLYWLLGCCEKSCIREILLFSLVIYIIQTHSNIAMSKIFGSVIQTGTWNTLFTFRKTKF